MEQYVVTISKIKVCYCRRRAWQIIPLIKNCLNSSYPESTLVFKDPGRISFFFNQDTFILWNIDSGSFSADIKGIQKMGPGGHDCFHHLPAPFNKHIDASAKVNQSTILLISETWYLRWDLKSNKPIDVPTKMQDPSGLFAALSPLFTSSINSAVESSSQDSSPGQVYLFTDTNWLLFDLINNRTLKGPDIIGESVFDALIPPFVPSQAEICQGYQDIIAINTDYRKTACIEDPSRLYPWQQTCMFENINPTCDQMKRIFNDTGGFCGSAISNGKVPLKSIDIAVRNSYINRSLSECKSCV